MRSNKKSIGWAGALMITTMVGAIDGAVAAEFKAGELIVKYKAGAQRSRFEMNSLYETAGVKSVKRLPRSLGAMDHIVLANGVRTEEALVAFRSSDKVEYAQPNFILRTQPLRHAQGSGIPCFPGFEIPGCDPGDGGGGGGGEIPCLIPGIPFPPNCTDPGNGGGEPEQPGQPAQPPANRPALQPAPADIDPPVADIDLVRAYGLTKIGATEAWKEHRGSKDFIVADIDTGIDYNHEDLSANLWRDKDADGKEFSGYDFVHNDNLPFDDNQHGTHTAGTIGAVGGNGKGVSGVAQRVSLMSLKFLSGEGSGTTADAIRAIDYAIEHGARVLSNSWGGKGDDGNKALEDAIIRARDKGVLFIAAAGNDGTDNDGSDPAFPAALKVENMISVAATDSKDAMAFFSNFGPKTTHLAAPGVDVYSTIPGDRYAPLSGTSMACPHVAGAAALLWSKHPEWDYKKVKEVLLSSTDSLSALKGKVATGGRLNILKALRSTD